MISILILLILAAHNQFQSRREISDIAKGVQIEYSEDPPAKGAVLDTYSDYSTW